MHRQGGSPHCPYTTLFRSKRQKGIEPYESNDPDTLRIWWKDEGVHQNMTFPVHPDPKSCLHCWHQAVHVRADRKSTRLNSSHDYISYAVVCVKETDPPLFA